MGASIHSNAQPDKTRLKVWRACVSRIVYPAAIEVVAELAELAESFIESGLKAE